MSPLKLKDLKTLKNESLFIQIKNLYNFKQTKIKLRLILKVKCIFYRDN